MSILNWTLTLRRTTRVGDYKVFIQAKTIAAESTSMEEGMIDFFDQKTVASLIFVGGCLINSLV